MKKKCLQIVAAVFMLLPAISTPEMADWGLPLFVAVLHFDGGQPTLCFTGEPNCPNGGTSGTTMLGGD